MAKKGKKKQVELTEEQEDILSQISEALDNLFEAIAYAAELGVPESAVDEVLGN